MSTNHENTLKRIAAHRFVVRACVLATALVTNACTGSPTASSSAGGGGGGSGGDYGFGKHAYCALAVSDGFDRNDSWAIACGDNLQGTINLAHAGCVEKSGTFCADIQQCNAISAPYVAFARVSAFDPRFVIRGSYGFVCSQRSQYQAQSNEMALCSYSQCQLLYSGAL